MSKRKKKIRTRKPAQKRQSGIFRKITSILERQRKVVILIILGLAFLLRLGFFMEISSQFPVSLHKWPASDMSFFHAWANRIQGGDLLTDTIYHPFHDWHAVVANAYFNMHPEKKIALQQTRGPLANYAHVQMNIWMGNEQFHQEPFYPYFMAMIYAVTGSRPVAVFIIQSLLGLLALLLLFLVTERYFGILPAVMASLLMVFAGIFLTYEFTLLRASIVTVFTILLLYWFQRTMDNPNTRNWIFLGIILALALLIKITFLLFLVGAAIWFFFSKSYRSHTSKHMLLGLLAFAITFSPLIIRNALVGAPLLSTNSVGAITAISPNLHQNTIGAFWVDGPTYARILDKADASTLGSLLAAINTHPSIFSYAHSLLRRAEQAFYWRSHTDNVNHHYWRQSFNVLKFAGVNFWLISPLALTGLFFCFYPKIRKESWPLLIMFMATIAPLVLFYVLERYRLPLLVVLLPFAGLGLSKIVLPGNIRSFIIAFAIAAGIFLWANEVFNSERPVSAHLVREVDLNIALRYHYRPKIEAYFAEKQFKDAVRVAKEYKETIPDFIYKFNKFNKPDNQVERDLLSFMKIVHTFLWEVASLGSDEVFIETLRADRDRMEQALM